MSEIKLTAEELQKIQDLRTRYETITFQLGQVKIEQLIITDQLKNLQDLETKFVEDYRKMQADEIEFTKSITEKYGIGEVNVETGEFTPSTQTV